MLTTNIFSVFNAKHFLLPRGKGRMKEELFLSMCFSNHDKVGHDDYEKIIGDT